MSEMTEERVAEIRARVDELPSGEWLTAWHGQQFMVTSADGEEIMEYTFAIPTWEPKYEAAKATCDVAVPVFVAHARQDVPDLLDALATERTRAEAAAAELAKCKLSDDSLGPCARCGQPYTKWELLGVSEQKHDVCYALDALVAAEGWEARLREALAAIVQVPYTVDGHSDTLLDRCLEIAAAALAGTETVQESLIRAGDELVREIDAALDGAPEG